jgi:hypothetical protein
MSGPIGLHGGGEYDTGDEPFLEALLAAATHGAAARDRREQAAEAERIAEEPVAVGVTGDRHGPSTTSAALPPRRVDLTATPASSRGGRPLRIVIVPTAAARGLPDRAGSNGRSAFERRAAARKLLVTVEVARIVDADSAADEAEVERLAAADLIHLPGGDPDLIPRILADTRALAAIETAWRGGAVVAGASAGAMALADWTWTAHGGIPALGFVRGIAVVPHYDDVRRTEWRRALDEVAPGGIGYLGLTERTGVLAEPDTGSGRCWRVWGPGAALWFARGSDDPVIAHAGEVLPLPE